MLDTEVKKELIPPPPPKERIRMVYFQTWPFSKHRYDGAAYCCGVMEWQDFVDLNETLHELGQRTWWKDITL